MRKIIVYKKTRTYYPKTNHTTIGKVEDGVATFLEFGVDFEEFESGVGNYSTAIIERPDGTVENVPVNMIRFITPSESIAL